uniref:Replication-associated protein n=1 Tax=Tarsiger cyanurus CRESS-DNA-virus sp. TaxID=2815060 RepID=A0A8A4XCM0_9VIRU|nr:MAG: replication-associated protein [Tarsiger cyanurus CRESS-DNA-virus sp.]
MPAAQEWKYVCFTSFAVDCPTRGDQVSYLVFQRESAGTTNREHWQGYAETAGRGRSVSWWQSALGIGKAHVERRKGTAQEAANYCRKEDTRLWGPYESGSISVPGNGGTKRGRDSSAAYIRAAAEAKDWREYIAILAEEDPQGVARSFNSIKTYAQHLFPEEEFPPYVAPNWCDKAWVLPNDLRRWVEVESIKKDRPKCLVLVGASRLGKTQWARSLGRHMYWRGMTNITHWDKDAKFLIFDDIEWDFIPQKKSLLTCMGEATVTDKYRAKKTVVVDKVAIVLCNSFDLESVKESDYWAANVCVVRVNQPLFDSSQSSINF